MIQRGEGTRPRRIALTLVAAWALICVVCVAPGSAEKPKKVATTSTALFVDAGSVSGSVLSHRSECKRGRKVTLRATATGKAALGTATTNGKGRWEITIQLGAGTYFADVASAIREGRKSGNDVRFHCRAVKSAPVTL